VSTIGYPRKCRDCAQSIVVRKTLEQGWLPFDEKPSAVGRYRVRESGVLELLHGDSIEEARGHYVALFAVHFDTCPARRLPEEPPPTEVYA
jgi:hypothetical protein